MEAPENPDISVVPEKSPSAIYIHIPFCRRECYYCNFSKYKYQQNSAEKYTDLLCTELKLRRDQDSFIKTVYFGGGSPAILPDAFLTKIIEALNENFNIGKLSEMTVEVNPEECSREKLSFLKSAGFNRISIGVQSISDDDLKYLARNHNGAQSLEALETAFKTGFDSVSADLIIGLPDQKKKTLENNVKIISSAGVNHLSAYILEGVKEYGGRKSPEEDHQSNLYNIFREEISGTEFEQYEVSNFCREEAYSEHNMNYWEGGSYIGAGLSASGYENRIDYTNYSDMDNYSQSIEDMKLPIAERIENDPVKRSLITGLRLSKGIEKEKFTIYESGIRELIEEGFLEETERYYRVVPSRMVVLNEILTYLI